MGGGRQTRRSVLVKDMASVHLSISKHSQLSCLSTGGEVIPFFLFSSASPSSLPLLISASPLLLQPFLPFHLSATLLSFYTLPSLYLYFFCQHSPIFFPPIPLHPSPRSPLLPISHALNGTAHSATKQSCLQHHTLANQARPEFSSSQIHSTTLWYCAALEGRRGREGGEAAWRSQRRLNIHRTQDRSGRIKSFAPIFHQNNQSNDALLQSKAKDSYRQMRLEGVLTVQEGDANRIIGWRKFLDWPPTVNQHICDNDETQQRTSAILSQIEAQAFLRWHTSCSSGRISAAAVRFRKKKKQNTKHKTHIKAGPARCGDMRDM